MATGVSRGDCNGTPLTDSFIAEHTEHAELRRHCSRCIFGSRHDMLSRKQNKATLFLLCPRFLSVVRVLRDNLLS